MNVAFEILTIGGLGWLAYQDFRYKLVSVFALITLFLFSFIYGIWQIGIASLVVHFSVNLLVIFVQVLICWLFLSLKQRRFINLTRDHLGLGDLVFFVVLAAMFSTINMVLIFTGALFLTVVAFTLYKIASKHASKEIPLVGALACLLIPLKLLLLISSDFTYFDDTWIFQYWSVI